MRPLGILLAAALLWLLQGILFRRWWKKGLSAELSFCQPSAVEGENACLTETITNAKYLPLPVLHVKFRMGRGLVFEHDANSAITDQNYRSDIFSCMPWQQIRRRLTFRCRQRGFYQIEQADFVSYDLLWTNPFVASVPVHTSMYVYPSFVDPQRLELPLRRLSGTMAARHSLLRDPFQLQSIRDYQYGDPYRDVNWKATARTGELKVNVHAPSASWQVTLLLDGTGDRLWEDADLKEEAVRLCATLADSLIARQIPVAVRTNGRDCLSHMEAALEAGSGGHHLQAILELLARIDLNAPERRPMEQMIAELLSGTAAGGQTGAQAAADTTLYILISICQRNELAESFANLCRKAPGSQWFLPLRPGDTPDFSAAPPPDLGSIYEWEVPYARSHE